MSERSVLITGGTGYLGRHLARFFLEATSFERICIYSRGEYQQAQMRREFAATDQGRLRWFIGDVRDADRLRRAMSRVSLVIHAAALKRVEVGEYNPVEMVRTNVDGAINVVNACHDQEVERAILISSDKACEPLNAYGATKLVAEKLFRAANNVRADGTKFAICRYGNVAGSTGSVIPTWRALIESQRARGIDEPEIPVTDPSHTRFWMTVGEAVELIRWTTSRMMGGEIVVPLLPAYEVGELAKAMRARVKVIGAGAGEKRDETMVAPFESHAFRYVKPYLVAGGIAQDPQAASPDFVRPRMMLADELAERLKEIA